MTAATTEPVAAAESLPSGSWAAPAVAEFVLGWPESVRRSRAATLLIPRLPLIAVLALISVLASRLMMANTAFIDEATYLSAGHIIWHHWLHGSASTGAYSSYFSGSPVIYPVIAAAVDAVGGLLAARLLSLGFILVAICLLYATSVRLFGRRAAGWTVVAFGTVAGTQYLAAFATYDAMALMLMALAVWLSIRCIQSGRAIPHGGLFVGAPILAFANATKYATSLFDPIVVAIVVLVVAAHYGWRQGVRCGAMYAAILAGLLAAGVALGGNQYITGILGTTLQRSIGNAVAGQVIAYSRRWVGAIAVLSMVSSLAAWLSARRRGSWDITTITSIALLQVLAVAAVLAPIEQARIATTVSLHKHVVFGAWFASIAVGSLLAQVSGERLLAFWRWTPPLATMVVLGVIGHQQALNLYESWPDSTVLMSTMRPYVDENDKPVLMDDSDIGLYYIGSDTDPERWSSTYYFQYTDPGTDQTLYGPAAYRSAIAYNHFGLVALNFQSEVTVDRVVRRAIRRNHHYQYDGKVVFHDSFGQQEYLLWSDRHIVDVR